MFEFIKNKVNKMTENKKAPLKKAPKKKAPVNIGAADKFASNICLGKDNKVFLTIEPDGSMVFNKNDFPGWKADNFAREFVNIVEEISGHKPK